MVRNLLHRGLAWVEIAWVGLWLWLSPHSGSRAVVVNASGGGNIGDQAMFETALQHIPGEICIIEEVPGAFAVPEEFRDRASLVSFPELVFGSGPQHFWSLARLGRLLASAKSVSVVGADIMDGGYLRRLSVIRWVIAIASARGGLDTRVLGFSWNSTPDPICVQLAHRASGSGCILFARDGHSRARLVDHGIASSLAADIVFTFVASPPDGNASQVPVHRPYVVVNMSGLIEAGVDLSADYTEVLRAARASGFDVVLVPHVARPESDDRKPLRKLKQQFPDDGGVVLVDELLTPSGISALVSDAAFVVTGRMHLSILALRLGVPAFVLSTQGKVSGLLQMFGIAGFALEPTPGFAREVAASLISDDFVSNATATVRSSLPEVVKMAERNFAGLGRQR